MKLGISIVAVFFIGVSVSYFDLHHATLANPEINKYILYVLLFLIGIGVGHNKKILNAVKQRGWRILAIPFSTIVGGLIGAAVVGLFLADIRLVDSLAVGSGLGYYSLSSILIADARGIELGTIALVANVSREIMALLFIPLIVKVFGKYSSIVAGGATTMDSTLPIIQQVSEENTTPAIVSGFICELGVPITVSVLLLL